MKELKMIAEDENLDTAIDFINDLLDESDCDTKTRISIDIAVEEVFVNIAHYAYPPEQPGEIILQADVLSAPKAVLITFIDMGTPYDPLAHPDPDITRPIEERPVGGMGLYLVKNLMDDAKYRFSDRQNILQIMKKI